MHWTATLGTTIGAEGSLRPAPRAVLRIVAICAGINLMLAVTLLTEPGRAADLHLIYGWCSRWLWLGEALYSSHTTDYPPNAIVMYSPIALIPHGVLVPVWAAVTVTLTPRFAYLAVRVAVPRATPAMAIFPALLMFGWGGARMLLQFTRLSLTLAYTAVLVADRWPMAAGVLLGIALSKPQIAGPIALWMLFTRRWRSLSARRRPFHDARSLLLPGAYLAPPSPIRIRTPASG